MLSEVEALKFLYIELGWVLKDKDPTTLPLFIMECIDRLPVRVRLSACDAQAGTQTGVNAVITTSHACPPEADLPSAWFVRVFRIPACPPGQAVRTGTYPPVPIRAGSGR